MADLEEFRESNQQALESIVQDLERAGVQATTRSPNQDHDDTPSPRNRASNHLEGSRLQFSDTH